MTRLLYTAFDVVPSPKGAGTHIMHVLRALVNAGYEVDLVTPSDGNLPGTDICEGARVLRVPTGTDPGYLPRALNYRDAVMRHIASSHRSYAAVHYRSIWCGLPLAQRRKNGGYRTIFEVNGLPSIELKYHYPGLRGADLLTKIREQEHATLALSDAVICPSDVTRAYLVSLGVPRSRITVIPNGVSVREFEATRPPEYEDGMRILLYLGTLADWQGLNFLVGTMPMILARHPEVRLRIVGPGRSRQRKDLARRVRKLGLAGHVSIEPAVPHHQVPAVIASAHICVAPLVMNDRNLTQGCCPIKILEYMSCARPIVAANLPVVREVVREEVDALLFAPNDADDLVDQVDRLLSDGVLGRRIATSAALRARRRFTWHHAGKRLVRLYERLLSSR
jgi:glycosyltransferase involved in cell wall biosynthesis